jgi:hypothetical protein
MRFDLIAIEDDQNLNDERPSQDGLSPFQYGRKRSGLPFEGAQPHTFNVTVHENGSMGFLKAKKFYFNVPEGIDLSTDENRKKILEEVREFLRGMVVNDKGRDLIVNCVLHPSIDSNGNTIVKNDCILSYPIFLWADDNDTTLPARQNYPVPNLKGPF